MSLQNSLLPSTFSHNRFETHEHWSDFDKLIALCLGGCGGAAAYGLGRVARYFSSIPKDAVLLPFAYIKSGLALGLAFNVIALSYQIGCRIVGPKEQYCDLTLSEKNTRIEGLRVRYWKVIKKAEGVAKEVDQLVCRTFTKVGIALRPNFEIASVEEQDYTLAERMRFIVTRSFKSTFSIQQFGLLSFNAIALYQGTYGLSFRTFSKEIIFFTFLGGLIEQYNVLKNKISKQIIAEENLVRFAKQNQFNFSTVEEVDLSACSYLDEIFLEKLIKRCPNLKSIRLNLTDLSHLLDFDYKANREIRVEIYPFTEYKFLKTSEFEQLSNVKFKGEPVHQILLVYLFGHIPGAVQFKENEEIKLKADINLDLTKKLVDCLYEGKFFIDEVSFLAKQFYAPKNMANTGGSFINLVGKQQDNLSDFSFEFDNIPEEVRENYPEINFQKQEESIVIPAYQTFLRAAHSQFLNDHLSNNKLDGSEWGIEAVLSALNYIYYGSLNVFKNLVRSSSSNSKMTFPSDHAIQEVSLLLKLAQDWKLPQLKNDIEKQLVQVLDHLNDLVQLKTDSSKSNGETSVVSIEKAKFNLLAQLKFLANCYQLKNLSEHCDLALQQLNSLIEEQQLIKLFEESFKNSNHPEF